MSSHLQDLASFVTASPSSYHAAAEVVRRLETAGFTPQREGEPWQASGQGYLVRDGAVIAWRLPPAVDRPVGFRIVGAHTDSPGFKLKPEPASVASGWSQAGMEVYGGPLANSWLDREFGLAGRLVTRTGAVRLVATPAWLRIPQLAPHLDRSAQERLQLDRQLHLKPITGVGNVDLLAAVAACAGLQKADIDGHDLFAAVSEPPAVIGVAGELFASPRLDNLPACTPGRQP